MRVVKLFSVLVVSILVNLQLFAREPEFLANNKSNQSWSSRSSGCVPTQSKKWLELNDVRCLIETGGIMWQDRTTGVAAYEVPAGSGSSAIYAGALWMGGVDANNQLKLAAGTFRSGGATDYWSGPLSFDPGTEDTSSTGSSYKLGYGAASVSKETCDKWDEFFYMRKQDVVDYITYKQCEADPACNLKELFPDGYAIPNTLNKWPGNGDGISEDKFMAPFYDGNKDGLYDPSVGTYPNIDFPHYSLGDESSIGYTDCRTNRRVTLYGDETYWWVFNDRGNVHTQTNGDPIGMEIRAQAFVFATNDEINQMTFYNYEMINRSTQTLFNTYFGQWVDADVGGAKDDFVGCDVQRGLGYAYNGDNEDLDFAGAKGYGLNPPAIGIDFFEGPFQDNDGLDNPGPTKDNNYYVDYNDALYNNGILYKGMGIGYGDGVVDNERFGMRKFVYYNGNGNAVNGEPTTATDYYNYLRGVWLNGQPNYYDITGDGTNNTGVFADYMFPGDTDPQGWGTGGVSVGPWTEVTAGNPPADRRFMQSAGPFTLQPGQVNNITVGIVYARSSTGDSYASVEKLRSVDDKAQALFDNCFQLLEGPNAPQLIVQEMENHLIFQIIPAGNNANEDYSEVDRTIPELISEGDSTIVYNDNDRSFKFEGYQIYQVKNASVSVSELNEPEKARLVFQSDIKNGIGQLINYESDEILGQIPVEMVPGQGQSDNGIRHSFMIDEDQFALGDKQLVNFKEYHFIAVAYAHNEFKAYDINDGGTLNGQRKPYLRGRKNYNGSSISAVTYMPRKSETRKGGTVLQSAYGDRIPVTRLEGTGNGDLQLELAEGEEDKILQNNFVPQLKYSKNGSPIEVKVVDPLNVPNTQLKLNFETYNFSSAKIFGDLEELEKHTIVPDSLRWYIVDLLTGDTVYAQKTIGKENEQILLDYGISVKIKQYSKIDTAITPFVDTDGNIVDLDTATYSYTELLGSDLIYSNETQKYISFLEDVDQSPQYRNWIKSGSSEDGNSADNDHFYTTSLGVSFPLDPEESFENIAGRTWAPYILAAKDTLHGPAVDFSNSMRKYYLRYLPSVDIVFTSDRSKWTRCAVVETQENQFYAKFDPATGESEGAEKLHLRRMLSVDKDGNPDGSTAPDGSVSWGMSWFPGYAINLTTGERLNIAFGEDSNLENENGNDMMFNPTSNISGGINNVYFGGKHYIYIFDNLSDWGPNKDYLGRYDGGTNIEQAFRNNDGSDTKLGELWNSCAYTSIPIKNPDADWLSNELRVKIRVANEYRRFATDVNDDKLNSIDLSENSWMPSYLFDLSDVAALTDQSDVAADELENIRVVPNPYYAYSSYETNRLDNRVRITNLPENCTVTIYNSNGTLIRLFNKSNDLTHIDWDLKNENNIPIAGGVYLFHINVPGVGEKVVKWFGTLRPPDLENF